MKIPTKLQAKPSSFSVDSILSNNNHMLRSINILTHEQTNQEMYLLLFKSDATQTSNLKLYDNQGQLINRIDMNEIDKEIFLTTVHNKSNLILCSKETTPIGEFASLSLYNSQFELELNKKQRILNLEQYKLLDLTSDGVRNKLFLLAYDLRANFLVIFVFNVTLDLINSFELNKDFKCLPKDLNNSAVKLFVSEDVIYVKQRTLFGTRLSMVEAIYGRLIKKCLIEYEFDYFYVTRLAGDDGKSRLVFLSNGKYFVYDLENESCLYFNYFYNIGKDLLNFFCLNSDGKIVTLFLS